MWQRIYRALRTVFLISNGFFSAIFLVQEYVCLIVVLPLVFVDEYLLTRSPQCLFILALLDV